MRRGGSIKRCPTVACAWTQNAVVQSPAEAKELREHAEKLANKTKRLRKLRFGWVG